MALEDTNVRCGSYRGARALLGPAAPPKAWSRRLDDVGGNESNDHRWSTTIWPRSLETRDASKRIRRARLCRDTNLWSMLIKAAAHGVLGLDGGLRMMRDAVCYCCGARVVATTLVVLRAAASVLCTRLAHGRDSAQHENEAALCEVAAALPVRSPASADHVTAGLRRRPRVEFVRIDAAVRNSRANRLRSSVSSVGQV
jgi:hypothetical protein